jgi:hypothetical protein
MVTIPRFFLPAISPQQILPRRAHTENNRISVQRDTAPLFGHSSGRLHCSRPTISFVFRICHRPEPSPIIHQRLRFQRFTLLIANYRKLKLRQSAAQRQQSIAISRRTGVRLSS